MKNANWLRSSMFHEGVSLRNLALKRIQTTKLALTSTEFAVLKTEVDNIGSELFQGLYAAILGKRLYKSCKKATDNGQHVNNSDFIQIRFAQRMPVSLALGYLYGMELSKLFGCSPSSSKRAAWSCALAHATGSLFDIILDSTPHLFSQAAKISFESLKRTFSSLSHHDKSSRDIEWDSVNPILESFNRTARAFGDCIARVRESGPCDIINALHRTILDCLTAEIPRGFESFAQEQRYSAVYDYLRTRNSVPFWAESLLCMAHANHVIDFSSKRLKRTILSFGDIFWVVDDITDFAEDLLLRHWNYLTLELANASGEHLCERPPGPDDHRWMYSDILRRDLIVKSVGHITHGLHTIEAQYNSARKSSERIRKLVGYHIYSNWARHN